MRAGARDRDKDWNWFAFASKNGPVPIDPLEQIEKLRARLSSLRGHL